MYGFILVALCWGSTNPWIKRGASGVEKLPKQNNFLFQSISEMIYLLKKPAVIMIQKRN